jgi:hypothetical protein
METTFLATGRLVFQQHFPWQSERRRIQEPVTVLNTRRGGCQCRMMWITDATVVTAGLNKVTEADG